MSILKLKANEACAGSLLYSNCLSLFIKFHGEFSDNSEFVSFLTILNL